MYRLKLLNVIQHQRENTRKKELRRKEMFCIHETILKTHHPKYLEARCDHNQMVDYTYDCTVHCSLLTHDQLIDRIGKKCEHRQIGFGFWFF